MSINIGDTLPAGKLFYMGAEGPTSLATSEVFDGKKVVLVGIVGPYTGTCNNQIPTLLEHVDAMKAKGVDEVVVVAVNDPFVMDAWSKVVDPESKLRFLSDGNAAWSSEMGMTFDGSKNGLNTRSLRYAAVVDNGKVASIDVEENPGVCSVSSGASILEAL